jgi:hypothetical protein
MATPAAMCATHRLTTSPCARVTPRARARASSRSRRTHVAHVSGESAGVGGVAARSGADETPSTSGAVSDPARDFAVAPSPSKLSRRASAGRAKHRRGAISAEWGSGEFDGGFDDAAETPATPPGGSRDTPRSLSTKRLSTVSTVRASTHSADIYTNDTKDEKKKKSHSAHDTELVMVLERRGEGWAEEVFPHVAMRRRPVARSAAAAAARGTHAPDSAQAYLEKTLRMSRDEAASIVSAAAAWRVTRGGRALVDRKIMRAVQANAAAAVEALRELGASVEDVPDLLRRMPQILAVVPTDEWNRNLLEYVVRARVPGGGRFGPLKLKARLPAQKSMNQAEASIERRAAAEARKTRRIARNEHILEMNARGSRDGPASVTSRRARAGADPLKPWVEDVRDKRQCGRLTQEQLYLLDIAGFDATVKEAAGGESNRTWEMWFDELVEYKSVVGSCEVPENRVDAGLGLWVQRQRVKRAEGTLSAKALARLLALGVSFEGYEPKAAPREVIRESPKSTRKSAKEVETPQLSARSSAVTKPSSTTVPSSDSEPPIRSARASALDRETLSMVASLKAFQKERGEFAEPPLGSELAVWLANVRNRAASVGASDAERDQKQSMSPAERDALLALGVELENFSPVWLGELERFASLRAHRVTLHDPKAHAAFVRRERAAANAGLCSRARLMRLRHVGMSGLSGALLLDDCELRGVDECLSAEALAQSGPYDGSDGGSLAAKTVAALPLRENALARETARAAREEAQREASAGDRPGERKPLASKPSARARARPTPVDAPIAMKQREAARTRRHQKPAGEGSERRVSSDAPFAPDASSDGEAREMLAEQMRAGKAVYVD